MGAHKRLGLSAVAVTAALACGTALAQTPSLSIQGAAPSLSDPQISSLLRTMRSAAGAAASGSGPTFYVDPARPADVMPEFRALGDADQAFARAASALFELHRAMGGTPGERMAALQRQGGLYYVALDGQGGRWTASADEALSFMFQSLVQDDYRVPHRTKDAVMTCAQDVLCAIFAFIKEPPPIATLPRGATAAVTMTGEGFAAGGTPIVTASDGILVSNVAPVDGSTLAATVQVTSAAKLGDNAIAVFAPGNAFASLAAYRLVVTAAAQEAAAPAAPPPSGGKAEAVVIPANGSAQGNIVATGAELYFRIDVSSPGTLTVTSSGGTDVKGVLEDANGAALAGNDDGGGWYNFKLSRAVAPGSYYLRVTHCCGGTGAYAVTATMGP